MFETTYIDRPLDGRIKQNNVIRQLDFFLNYILFIFLFFLAINKKYLHIFDGLKHRIVLRLHWFNTYQVIYVADFKRLAFIL